MKDNDAPRRSAGSEGRGARKAAQKLGEVMYASPAKTQGRPPVAVAVARRRGKSRVVAFAFTAASPGAPQAPARGLNQAAGNGARPRGAARSGRLR